MSYVIAVFRFLAIVFGFEVLVLLMLVSGPSLLADSKLEDPAATSVPTLAIGTQDPPPMSLRSPELPPAPFNAQPLIQPKDGSQEGKIHVWSRSESAVSYNVVDQCLCPRDSLGTMPLFEYGQADDDCSLIGSLVYRSGGVH